MDVTSKIELLTPMYSTIIGKSPSVGGGLSPNAHLSLIRASSRQTTMPTNRSTAETRENVFLKRRRGSLYNATKVTPLETDMGNESKEKLIPPPRHDDKRITAPWSEIEYCLLNVWSLQDGKLISHTHTHAHTNKKTYVKRNFSIVCA